MNQILFHFQLYFAKNLQNILNTNMLDNIIISIGHLGLYLYRIN